MKKHTLTAEKRSEVGKKNRKLKKEGFVSGVVYGKDIKSISIKIPVKDFLVTFKQTGHTGLIDLNVAGEMFPSLIKHLQFHPVSGSIQHVEFHKVNLKEKISAKVPLDLVGESPAQRDGVGLVLQTLNEVEVEALPTDLPEKIEIDISKLANLNDQISVGELVKPNGVEILTSAEDIIVKITEAVSQEAKHDAEVAQEAAAQSEAETTESTAPVASETPSETPKTTE